MALRIDIGTLRPAKRLADGRLRAEAFISRAGIFEYLDERGKIRRELRPIEEVFDPDSLASFEQVPVTNDHPDVGNLDADIARTYMVGSTGDRVERAPDPAGRGEDHVKTSVMVADSKTVRDMENGKCETSSGYHCDIEETSGVHPLWGRYDVIQRKIRGNHVAIVDSARAGRTVRVRMDSAATQIKHPPARGEAMDPEKLQEMIRSLSAQLEEANRELTTHRERADSAAVRADTEHGQVLQLQTQISELKTQLASRSVAIESEALTRERTRADAAEKKVARFDATIEQRVRERSQLISEARVVMGNDFRCDDLNEREIRAAVVKRLDASADVGSGVEDGIIKGRYLALISGHADNARSQARVAEVVGQSIQNAPRVDAREQQKRKLRDQWKQPLPNDFRATGSGKES